MAFSSDEDRRSWERTYHLERYHRLRDRWIANLGGVCSTPDCGSKEDLQFDHKDRSTKSFNISDLWGLPQSKIEEELKKCQLLCPKCHLTKTKSESSKGHGTWGMYRNRKCRCDKCRAFVSSYMKRYGPKK